MDDLHTAIPLGTSRLPLPFLLSIAAPSGWLPVSDSQRSPHGCAEQTLSQPTIAPLDLHHHVSLQIQVYCRALLDPEVRNVTSFGGAAKPTLSEPLAVQKLASTHTQKFQHAAALALQACPVHVLPQWGFHTCLYHDLTTAKK